MIKKLLLLVLVLGFVSSVQATVVVQWEFEDNVNDTSGQANHGSFLGGTASYVAGVDGGKALDLDGSDDRVVNLAATNLPLAGTGIYTNRSPDWSMNMYVKNDPANNASYTCMGGFGNYTAAGEGRFLCDKYDRPFLSTNTLDVGNDGTKMTANVWQMLTIVGDRSAAANPAYTVVSHYLDGVFAGSAEKGLYEINSAFIFVGWYNKYAAGSMHWEGLIDGFEIYNHVLSTSEIDTLYERIPEPATIALLGLGGLVLLRKKR